MEEQKSEREQALSDSYGCPHCDGTGLATVYRRDGLPFLLKTMGGHYINQEHMNAACICPYGRWLYTSHVKPMWHDLEAIRHKVFTRLERITDDELDGSEVKFKLLYGDAKRKQLEGMLKSARHAPKGDAYEEPEGAAR